MPKQSENKKKNKKRLLENQSHSIICEAISQLNCNCNLIPQNPIEHEFLRIRVVEQNLLENCVFGPNIDTYRAFSVQSSFRSICNHESNKIHDPASEKRSKNKNKITSIWKFCSTIWKNGRPIEPQPNICIEICKKKTMEICAWSANKTSAAEPGE